MTRGQAGTLLLLAVPVIWALLWWGWRGRQRRDSAVVPLPTVPAELGDPAFGPVEATYVSTTRARDWLDRVAAHGLGYRSAAQVGVHAGGVMVAREGEPALWLATELLTGVRRERAIAGKVGAGDGLVVIGWRLGDLEVDTGLRTRYEHDREPLVAAVTALLPTDEEAAGA